jgi:hypothetical protein
MEYSNFIDKNAILKARTANTNFEKVSDQCSADTFVVKIPPIANLHTVKQPYGSPNSSTITLTCAGVMYVVQSI